jgi:hypothetical protein
VLFFIGLRLFSVSRVPDHGGSADWAGWDQLGGTRGASGRYFLQVLPVVLALSPSLSAMAAAPWSRRRYGVVAWCRLWEGLTGAGPAGSGSTLLGSTPFLGRGAGAHGPGLGTSHGVARPLATTVLQPVMARSLGYLSQPGGDIDCSQSGISARLSLVCRASDCSG